jgi:transketolase
MNADLQDLATRIRLLVLEQSRRANVGHIGSALSVAEIVAALYGDVLRSVGRDPDRDRFVLSKGHAALAVYAALSLRGLLSAERLDSYCADDSLLGVHPERALEGIDFSTGSLGHGLSIGAGAALGARLAKSQRRVFVLMSDAECNEGAVWEAAMFASHHHLSRLVAIIDMNGQQALGYTRDVSDPAAMADRWTSFGWDVVSVDGHDPSLLARELNALETTLARPRVVLARTVFGKGVPFMESRIEWHYMPMSQEQFEAAHQAVRGVT